MKRLVRVLPLILLLSGCVNNTPSTPQSGSGSLVSQQTDPSGEYTVDLSLPRAALTFPIASGETITLTIEQPSPKTVVRVSQIIDASGQADGPFSSMTSYTAPKTWLYKFVIGINQMASEDVFTGNVKVQVSFKR